MNITNGTPKTIEQAIDNALTEAVERWGKDFAFHDVSGDKLVKLIRDHVQDFLANRCNSADPAEAACLIGLFYSMFPKAPRGDLKNDRS